MLRDKNRQKREESLLFSGIKGRIINKVLFKGRSLRSISLDYTLSDASLLKNWIAQYKKNGYTIVEKARGRPSKMGRKRKKIWK